MGDRSAKSNITNAAVVARTSEQSPRQPFALEIEVEAAVLGVQRGDHLDHSSDPDGDRESVFTRATHIWRYMRA